ncbi:hypothetical protein EEL32_01500 [Brevibacillus laterosporus]|nr:hypothetical protein [Brevibacillus laterosporus]TPG70835.1 hypothetical protein EEL31_21910 [Brevibacillus laterosporus]TPG92320.1 hypothetical protein EEL32_01500 [Brevibacillus laterosporus]
MPYISIISQLWSKRQLPFKDGFYFADGESIACHLNVFPEIFLTTLRPFNLGDFLSKTPMNITNFHSLFETYKEEHRRFYCVGAGTLGHNGFVAALDEHRHLQWVACFEKSFAFNDLVFQDHYLIAGATEGFQLQIPFHSPEKCVVINQLFH